MGGVVSSIGKAVGSVTKSITKVVKSTAKAIKKVGTSVMKGVSKISSKLGPVGMIALSIAMPYALAGLSSMTTAAMASNNVFLQAVGQVGNSIRLGYQAFNTGVSNAFSSITNSISKAFTKFAPQGVQDMFSAISEGAKNLYTSAQETVSKYMPKPFTAEGGTVEFYDDDGLQILKSSDAAKYIEQGTLDVSRLGEQTLTKPGGIFTSVNKVGIEADKIVSETINKAYANRLEGFGPNARRMFSDLRNYSQQMGTYINDEQIGSYIENNIGTTQNRYITSLGDTDMAGKLVVNTETDLLKTGDYILNEDGKFTFNGGETFKAPPVKNALAEANKEAASKAKKALGALGTSLLTPKPLPQPDMTPYQYAGASGYSSDMTTGYGGTDIKGTAGGNLVAQVFGADAANRISNYYRNMNILASA